MLKTILAAGLLAAATFTPAYADDADPMPIRLHRYTSPLYAWNTNSYWLESKEGVVLIDAQLLPSDARYLAAAIKASGKPLKGVIITHGHLDHIGGLNTLRAELGDFALYETEANKAAIPNYLKQVPQYYAMPNRFGEPLAETAPEPDHIINAGDKLTIAGIELEIFGGGPGEADDNIGIYAPTLKAIFSGDMSYPFSHFYAGNGHATLALEHMKAMRTRFEEDMFIYSGHTNPARVVQLDEQIEYVSLLINDTRAAMDVPENLGEDGMLKREARRVILNTLLAKYPNYETFGFVPRELIPGSIYGVEQEYAAEKKAKAAG